MADEDLRCLVEAKMSSLSMDNALRQSSKSNLPFTVMSLGKDSHVVNFFEVPDEKDEAEVRVMDKPKFGVATVDGSVLVFDTMFRRITWKQRTYIDKVSWGCFSKRDDSSSTLIHSRQDGLHLVSQLSDDEAAEKEGGSGCVTPNKTFSYDTHIGFCKPLLCSDKDVLLPVGMDRLGILRNRDPENANVATLYNFSSSLMTIKEIAKADGGKYILCCTDDGYVHLLQVDCHEKNQTVKLVSKLLLPKYQDVEEQPIGICIEGCDSTFVVGSSSKYIFLLKWTKQDEPNSLAPTGKKILPTEGVSCMAMREGRGILAAGCFDGTLRLFSFPDMNQISTINYHASQVYALLFVNEKKDKTGRWFLLSSANEAFISVWNIPCSNDAGTILGI